MKEYSCSDGHQFDAKESKEEWFGMKVCPECWPNGLPRKSPSIVEWISVKERLPEKDTKVLYASVYGNIYMGHLETCTGNEFFWTHYDFIEDFKITHWMPLPEPPAKADLLPKPTKSVGKKD